MKILVLPDVHEKLTWKKIIEEHFDEADKVYFLGDYFDNHGDNEVSGEDAVKNFEEIVQLKKDNPDKVFLCFGNHDQHYLFGFDTYSNYQENFAETYRNALLKAKDQFNMCYRIPGIWGDEDIYISHAGISKKWYEHKARFSVTNENLTGDVIDDTNTWFHNLMDLEAELQKLREENLDNPDTYNLDTDIGKTVCDLEERVWHLTSKFEFDYSGDRYGDSLYSPPTWIRPNALLSSSTNRLQIVGHTGLAEVKPRCISVSFYDKDTDARINNRVVFVDSVNHDIYLFWDTEETLEWEEINADESKE